MMTSIKALYRRFFHMTKKKSESVQKMRRAVDVDKPKFIYAYIRNVYL